MTGVQDLYPPIYLLLRIDDYLPARPPLAGSRRRPGRPGGRGTSPRGGHGRRFQSLSPGGRDAVQPRLRGSTVTGTAPRSTRGDGPRHEGGATMNEMTIDVLGCLEEAESRLRALTSGLTEADLVRPTPCTEWDVRALVSHT